MDRETYDFLEASWLRHLPRVPWPFDITATPEQVVTSMGSHLSVQSRRPPLQVRYVEILNVEPRPCNPPEPGGTKDAA